MFDLFASILESIESQYDGSVINAAIDAMQAIAARQPECMSMHQTIGVIRAMRHADLEYWPEFYSLACERMIELTTDNMTI